MPKKSLPNISVIGSGSVGSSLAIAFFEKGYPIASIIGRTGKSALALAKAVKCRKVSTQVEDIDPSSDIVIIAVSDPAIGEVAETLSKNKRLKFRKLFVFHTSGLHTSTALQRIEKKGALTASVHPIQTFSSGRKRTKVQGIYFGVEGSTEGVSKAMVLVTAIGGKAIAVPPKLKPLYHVACVFASSYTVVILNAIQELSKQLGLSAPWTEVFGPLMTTAMENTIRDSAANALTGPVLRGDSSTITAHLGALAQSAPQFLPVYTIAGTEVARIAREHGRISQQEYQSLITEFRQFIKSLPQHSKGRH